MTTYLTWTNLFIAYGIVGAATGLLVIFHPYFQGRWARHYSRQYSWALWATVAMVMVIITWPVLWYRARRR